MIRYTHFATPLGTMLATSENDALTALDFVDAKYVKPIGADWVEDRASPLFARAQRQVTEYFAGKRKTFDLPIAPEGTAFQKRVWREIARVPFGETISYGDLARRAGASGSARAAGAATGRNPLAVVVPCHRIVASDGALTGYAGGIERKVRLLELEGALQRSLV